jgi:hypothetical protein
LFVGAARFAQVKSLLVAAARSRALRESGMVVFVAPPGSGKTRIIQEFYRELAATQPDPPYWPPSLVDEEPDGGLGLRELTTSRKTVRYRGSYARPADAEIPWLWIAPAVGTLSDGSPAPAFDSVISQVTSHVPALIKRLGAARGDDPERDARIRLAVADLLTGPGEPGDRPGHLSGLLSALLPEGGRFAAEAADGQAGGEAVSAVLVIDDAHELDEQTVGFVREIIAAELPFLVIATTWPEKLTAVGDQPLSPFCSYLAEAGGSDRIRQAWIGQLDEDDLIAYVLSEFPATGQDVAAALARRADRNPYALRLLLNTPRVSGSVRDGRITLDPREIADLNGRLDTLLQAYWEELPAGVRQILVAAALLGQSFLDEVLEAGLRRYLPAAGLDEALDSSWIRSLGGQDRVLEFAERLRYDLAKGAAPQFLSNRERAEIYGGALRAVRRLLQSEPEGTGRIVLLALHVLLAREGAEDDLTAAAASAVELAERARSEFRRIDALQYYQQAIAWMEATRSAPTRDLADYLVRYAGMTRIHYGLEAGEPLSERAVKFADEHLDQGDELRIHARCALGRARRRREDPEAYADARALLAEARRLLGQLVGPSAEVSHDVRAFHGGLLMSDGHFDEGAELFRELAAFSEEHFGPVHRYTIADLSDLGYCLHRSAGPERSIEVRRLVVERRVRRFNDAGHLQAMGAKSDLAFSLLESRDPGHLDEAEKLIEESITRKSRVYGFDGKPLRGSRIIRVRIWLSRGLIAEAAGDTETATRLFTEASEEASRVRELRKEARPGSQAVAVQRHGEALACLRWPEAITALDDALDIQETTMRRDHTFWAVRDSAKSLWWTYRRIGREAEAEAVARRYRLPGASEDWIPAFVPRR